jgi:hypothetical protein
MFRADIERIRLNSMMLSIRNSKRNSVYVLYRWPNQKELAVEQLSKNGVRRMVLAFRIT